jgi:ABC-2 type transport system ATP-binding protein
VRGSMRAGRVLDAGSPAELVARHGRRATIGFAAPDAGVLAELRSLPGVWAASHGGGQATVHGERESIAHVGAWLTRRGTVPPDLRVEVPDLEDALLALLDGATLDLDGAAR